MNCKPKFGRKKASFALWLSFVANVLETLNSRIWRKKECPRKIVVIWETKFVFWSDLLGNQNFDEPLCLFLGKWISTLISKWNFYLLKQSVGAERRKIFVKKFYWKQRQRNVVYLLHHLFSIRNFVNSFINNTYYARLVDVKKKVLFVGRLLGKKTNIFCGNIWIRNFMNQNTLNPFSLKNWGNLKEKIRMPQTLFSDKIALGRNKTHFFVQIILVWPVKS